MASVLASLQNAVDQLAGDLVEVLIGARLLEPLHGLDACGHGQRVAAEGARLVHGASRSNHLHDVPASAIGTHGQATADDLAQTGDIRGHAEICLCTTIGNAESSHDLVEDQERTVLGAELTEPHQELLRGRDETRVSDDRLQDHGGDLVFLQQSLHGCQIVVGSTQGASGRAFRDTGRVRQAQSGDARASLHQESIGMAVVAALELDDLFALGVSPNQSDHAHACLGAGVGESDHLHRGNGFNDHLGQHILQSRGGSEGGALLHLLAQSLENLIVSVADDGWAPCADVVDVLVAVHIPSIRTLNPVEHNRVATNGLEGAYGAGDTARHQILRLGEDPVGLHRLEGSLHRPPGRGAPGAPALLGAGGQAREGGHREGGGQGAVVALRGLRPRSLGRRGAPQHLLRRGGPRGQGEGGHRRGDQRRVHDWAWM
mmetsp:Transcript_29086/g.93389  ORF Transcript_29086/g.93389 Transcript_29086/m.93389 type:complete len:431 (-) Transcript_29086:39-1331(-)